jgi:hypothetical protein
LPLSSRGLQVVQLGGPDAHLVVDGLQLPVGGLELGVGILQALVGVLQLLLVAA